VTVGAGELLACYVFGSVLLSVLYRTPVCRVQIAPERLKQLRGFPKLD